MEWDIQTYSSISDGNHKLIRYRLVILGGIDGISRVIAYLKCSNNNTASTVLESLEEATRVFGVPSRICSDDGGENVGVWDYMTRVRGDGRSSYITGSSVHNSRIERLWRDVYVSVASTFAAVFDALEVNDVLDPLNEVDIFCLHYVYVPRINATFSHAWNIHPLSTESNYSPMQLFMRHSIGNPLFSDNVVADSGSFISDSNAGSIVYVPESDIPLSDNAFQALDSHFKILIVMVPIYCCSSVSTYGS